MSSTSLADLALRHGLAPEQQERLDRLLHLLESDALAPTAVRSPEQAVAVHLADALCALAVQPLAQARRLADIGAGAGFPGLALAVALPEAEVLLVESQRRKCEFLSRACAAAGAGNARVVCSRAEEWEQGRGRNDAVTARALAAQPVVLEYAAPLLGAGGVLVDWRGRRDAEEEERALRAAGELGLELVEIRRVDPFAGARNLHLHVFAKTAATPERFPRRAGVARKRPLEG